MRDKSPFALSRGAPWLVVMLLAFWLRIPFVATGLPYFYNEDEAHHFNRTVEMVKSGDYNPHYFHKPSLHFYLRMPAVALGFLWNVREGNIRSVKEIRTRDPYGLGGYAFGASHPGIVKWNRAFSLLLSLALVALTGCAARALGLSCFSQIGSMLLCAVSPELVSNSALVAVDVLMALNCLIAVYLAIELVENLSLRGLALCGFFAGLAVSSKYNALPVCLVPLCALAVTGRFALAEISTALLTPALGFVAGSPYALLSLPLFLDQFAYEIWHYGIAGHEGHTAQPGIEQLIFYVEWFISDGLGLLALLALVPGLFWLALRGSPAGEEREARRSKLAVFVFFPALFFALMCSQRANFTRNVIVLVPFAAIFVVAALDGLSVWANRSFGAGARTVCGVALLALVSLQPLCASLGARSAAAGIAESRADLVRYLDDGKAGTQIAVAGQLQLAPGFTSRSSVRVVDGEHFDAADLYQHGADMLALPAYLQPSGANAALLELAREFPGAPQPQRVVENPSIKVYSFQTHAAGDLRAAESTLTLRGGDSEAARPCEASDNAFFASPGEPYCWIGVRRLHLDVRGLAAGDSDRPLQIRLRAMSPWADQKLRLAAGGKEWNLSWSASEKGAWKDIVLEVDSAQALEKLGLLAEVARIERPLPAQGATAAGDQRLLGIAISNAGILKSADGPASSGG